MLKTRTRRILAFLCAISVLVSSCFVLAPKVAAEAGDETPVASATNLKSMMQEGYTVVTPQTFGVPDTTGAAVDANFSETLSLDKLLFAANVTRADDGTTTKTYLYYLQGPTGQNICRLQMIPKDDRIYFYNEFDYSDKAVMYRGDSGTGTTKAYGSSTSSNYFSLKPADFGITSFKGSELEIWITTEFVKAPWLAEGEADDLKIGIWVNGNLYTQGGTDTYFYVLDCQDNTYKGELKTSNEKLAISSPSIGTSGSSLIDFIDVEAKLPEGYQVVTPQTFGVPDTTGAAVDADFNETLSLDKLLFAANVTRADDGTTTKTYLYYLQGPTGQNICRLQMIPKDDRIYFYNEFDYSDKAVMYRGDSGTGTTKAYGSSTSSNYFSLKPADFGITSFKGSELEIWITTEFVKAPWLAEGEADDLKIGIWVNGNLYTQGGTDTYFYVLDCQDNTYKGELKTSNEKLAISSPFMEPNDMGMVGGEYASAAGEFYASNLVANKVMDGITFQSCVRFEGEGGTLYYGSQNDEKAIKFTSTTEGILVTYGAQEIGLINQSNVGIDVLNHNFDLKLETEFVDCDSDALTDDVKLGIYVNNKYSSVDLVDAAATLTAITGVKTTGDATVLVGDFASEAPEQVSWDLSNGAYTIEKTNSIKRISVDGVSVNSNLSIDTVGTYSVVVTENGKVYMKDVTVTGTSTEPPVNPPGGEEPPVNPPGGEEPPVDPPVNPPVEPPVEPEGETLPTDFTKITPVDFGIYNGTYTSQETGALTPVSSMDKVLFETDVTYGTSNGNIRYMKQKGKTIDNSIRINYIVKDERIRIFNYLSDDTKLYVNGAGKEYINIKPDVAISGAKTFADLKFTLSITTEYVDYDNDGQINDIKMGLWFNGKLYNEQYIYLKDCAAKCEASLVVNKVTVDTLNGEAPVITEPTLPEITFSDFDISDGTYVNTNKSSSLTAVGKYSEGVANKSFVGTVNFTATKTSYINIGGFKDGWQGVRLTGNGDSLKFSSSPSGFAEVTIKQKDVAVALIDNDVRFKLSIEVVDLDNDGMEDDVRFWLYFEDVLYQGKPIAQAIDYAQHLGNYLGIYSNKATSSVTIKSANLNRPKVEVDFSVVGFTKDWKNTLTSTKGAASGVNSVGNRAPYTGDQSTVGIYLVMSVLSLAALAYVFYTKRNKMSE